MAKVQVWVWVHLSITVSSEYHTSVDMPRQLGCLLRVQPTATACEVKLFRACADKYLLRREMQKLESLA